MLMMGQNEQAGGVNGLVGRGVLASGVALFVHGQPDPLVGDALEGFPFAIVLSLSGQS
jgi:hypothetical protein